VRAWRAKAQAAIHRGKLRAPTAVTLAESAEDLIAGMRSGKVRTKSGDLYKPSAIRGYERALRARLLPELGAKRLGDLQRRDVQRLADSLTPATLRGSRSRSTSRRGVRSTCA
jgi:hypothetical protein